MSQHTGELADLDRRLPDLIRQLTSASPDLGALIAPAADLWAIVTGLVAGAPVIALPDLPNAGSILDVVLGASIDDALRGLSPATWAFLRSIQLIGPDLPTVTALGDFLGSPTGFVWQRFQGVRRNIDITITGLVTGPRTTSIVINPDPGAIDPAVAAALPGAATVVGRVTVRLAADTFDEPVPITFELIGDATDPPGFVAAVVRTPPWLAPIALSRRATLDLAPLTGTLGVALTSFGTVVALTAGQPDLSLATTFAGGFTLGPPRGIHLEAGEPVLAVSIAPDSWGARVGVGQFEVTIPADIAGPLLAMLLPSDGITLRGRLVVVADAAGLHLDGGVGLSTTWPDTIRLPGVVVRDMKTSIAVDGAGFTFAASATAVVSLGPLTVTIEGLGIDQRLALTTGGNGNLGLLDVAVPGLLPPTGFGVSLDASIIKGGGFLRIDGDEIAGALELALKLGPIELTVRAVGVLGHIDGKVSFVVVMSVEFQPAIEIFLGLTLNAVGGVFGLNRSMDTDGLTALVRSGRMSDLMFPDDLAARAPEIIDGVKRVFPAHADQFVIGPMLKLGWGRPISFVTLEVGVVFTFPDPVIVVIIGNLRLALPAPELPIIDLQAGFAGGINFSTGEVFFDASLARSRIGGFDVAGDLCLRAGPSGFVFSAGGFHPKFQPPSNIGKVERLSISISPNPILNIRAEAYFAVTASTLQFGAGLFMDAELGPLGAHGHIGLDVLIKTEPRFSFLIEISGQFRLTFDGEDIISIDLDVLLEGPGYWHARAHARIHFLFITISGTLELSWGEESGGLGAAVDAAGEVAKALQAEHVWSHVLPVGDSGVVHLRNGADGLHPLGSLRLTQTAAPLGQALARYGANAVASPDPIAVTVLAAGIGAPAPAQELFAPAQFFAMSDDERLSKPAFVPYLAGYVVQGDAWQPLADHLVVDIVYEEATDDGFQSKDKRLVDVDETVLAWAGLGAAGRKYEATATAPKGALAVNEVTYAVADAKTGATLSGFAAANAFGAAMRASADTVVMADYERVGVG